MVCSPEVEIYERSSKIDFSLKYKPSVTNDKLLIPSDQTMTNQVSANTFKSNKKIIKKKEN